MRDLSKINFKTHGQRWHFSNENGRTLVVREIYRREKTKPKSVKIEPSDYWEKQ